MGVWEAFLAHPDRDFICKWAIEFGDRKLLLMLAENRPKELIESAIRLGNVSYMVDLADRMGVGHAAFQNFMLNHGSLRGLSGWAQSKHADRRAIVDRMREIAADAMPSALAEFSENPSLELEEAIIETGDRDAIRTLAAKPPCDAARRALAELESMSEVMES